MARLTKMRARQTRAADNYSASDESLATDGEVERRVRKHSAIFHGIRDDNTEFIFEDGVLSSIKVYLPDTDDVIKSSDFTFDNGILTGIYNEVYDLELDVYVKKQKDLSYDSTGTIESIKNTLK